MIRVLVPDLPRAEELAPYLQRIDAARWYSNGGPLVRELEQRMGGVAVSSGTLGLELAAKCVFKKKRVRIPALTFVATGTALLRAGFEPVLCDVDETWALRDIDENSLPVCPFGASVKAGALIDAAAGWGNQHFGDRVYSLHATKALPAGEGGMVCGSQELLERVRRLANFGMDAAGIVSESGTNAKLSEYHAAVGLASIDRWYRTSKVRRELAALYDERLGDIERQPRSRGGVYTIYPVQVPNPEGVARLMAEKGIETRRWYVPTLDKHPAFAHLPIEGDLENTRRIAGRLLCLPFHAFLTANDVQRVCEVLKWAITKTATVRSFTGLQTSSGMSGLEPARGLMPS